MKYFLYGALALLLGACSQTNEKPANQLTANDFESMDGWMGGTDGNPSVTKEKAHSGVYSVKVDPAIEYSAGYGNPLSKLSSSRLGKLKLRGWVFVPSDKDAPQLVVQLQNPGEEKPLLWEGLDLHKEAQAKGFNKWIELDHDVVIPPAATAASLIRVYLWRANSPEPVYLDDLQLDRVE